MGKDIKPKEVKVKKVSTKKNKKAKSVNNRQQSVKVKSTEIKKVKTPKDIKTLKVRFLGGVGEIGKNMTVLEYGKDIIVIDAGITFPSDSMPGVDLVIPDFSFLEKNKTKIRGLVITHGHEDHIGSVPYLLKTLNVPIYGTKLTLTLIENKIKEHKINNAILNCVKPSSTIKLGGFSIEFINVNHSIAGAVGLAIKTPIGTVFHSGDFKIDFSPVNGETMDLPRISELGKEGVLLLMADSTNIEIDGTTMSESVVKDTLDHVFSDNEKRRLIIATFASNVHRLQQILDLAEKHKRKVAFSGRSMINIAESASKIGELTVKSGLIVDIDKIKNYRDNEIIIVSTGTQGEPMSALTRMASGEFNRVKIGENDTVVISASVIPGNERMIYSVINNLYRLGAEVIYSSLEPIHVSGHACRDELKVLHSLVKPKFFVPVHGEYRHLKKHQKLAESLGMRSGNILIADIGDTIELTSNSIKFGEKFPAGSRFVDGMGIDDTDSLVIRDRIHLAEDGLIVASVGISARSGQVKSIEILTKGLVLSDAMIIETKKNLAHLLDQIDLRKVEGQGELSNYISRALKNHLSKALKKNPMIIPMVVEI
ncbi:MAG: ribonuclease J [Clostridia bacterium]|nr:ribonuclease J [Clostridia bacterium]